MNSLTVVSGVRVLAAAFVAVAGLAASAPQVHGTVQTRGAVTCNINVIATPNCGAKANYVSCEVSYIKCKSLTGPKDKVCTLISGNACAADNSCYIQTNYSWSTDCTPTSKAPSAFSNATSGSVLRPSQVQ